MSLLPGLLGIAARNARHGVRDVRIVEVGKVFEAVPPPLGAERVEVALLVTGEPHPWDRPGAEPDRMLELRARLKLL